MDQMEKKMENEMETRETIGVCIRGKEKKMETAIVYGDNGKENGNYCNGVFGFRV